MPSNMSTSTVAGVLREQARARADRPLLICDDDVISYAEADGRSARLAGALLSLGAGKGTHVGVLYPNGTAFVVATLAAARIGAVVVPFSTFCTARELREQLAHGDVRILLATRAFRSHDYAERLAGVLDDIAVPLLRHVFFDWEPGESADQGRLAAMEDDVNGCDPLAIVYTSGSTDTPKGAVHTHAGLLEHQRNLNGIRNLSADDKLFCNSPFFWIGGFAFGLLATLVAGSTLVCSNAADAGDTLDLLEAEKPTITNGFAAAVAHLTRHPSFPHRDLSSMRRGNLYPIMAPDARPADPELRHNMLGMTEAGGVVLLSGDETDQPERRRGSFGRPAPGFDVKIVDGELCLRGPYLMQRYHRRSREESFDADGWFHTGDLVRADADGFYYFLGRRGSMIKTAGANVSPEEVARAITRVTGGLTAYVVGVPDRERGQAVAAAIVVEDEATVDEGALRRELKSELSAYKIPRRIVPIRRSDVPLMSSGKVDMGRLAKVFDG
ncbi:acyl--CoA ligase [Mycobacterium malmoense]|uniref:AMP-binding protein n=1 Tax=Mycobacterium malmoense TaxID=1780 RepID=A0ABX3SQB5_MYCMA|nr:class I adenylate-forming enzyme family protein [Mycobacterium malmoense]ORA81418.1 AMP-binding protein [Mycobacterium malmoense]QZA16410.1 acyl--CoA ligase [Mycobacterium malmoense]UNB93212.1 acyl--CoA ligase [Mycobacterium malmoense]